MIRAISAEAPQVAYVGWAIAIPPSDPIWIEGNPTPGYAYYQISVHMENRCRDREIYEKY